MICRVNIDAGNTKEAVTKGYAWLKDDGWDEIEVIEVKQDRNHPSSWVVVAEVKIPE